MNALDSTATGPWQASITKLDPSGSTLLLFPTYLSGTYPGHADFVSDIALDGMGNAYVAGITDDLNFPTTTGAYLSAPGGTGLCGNCIDGWVAKLDPTGSSLIFSTYLTGNANNVQSEPAGIAW